MNVLVLIFSLDTCITKQYLSRVFFYLKKFNFVKTFINGINVIVFLKHTLVLNTNLLVKVESAFPKPSNVTAIWIVEWAITPTRKIAVVRYNSL